MKQLDKNTIEEIRKDYQNKELSIKDIAKKYNISVTTIYRHCKDLQRNSKKEKLMPELEKAINEYNTTNIPIAEIAKKYKISESVIYSHTQNNRRGSANKGREYSLKENALMIDSREKFYWLGFIAADGAVVNNSLVIELKTDDKNHLQKFCNFLETDRPIIDRTNNSNSKCSRITIYSVNIINFLKQYNIVQNKSLSFFIPVKKIPNYYLMDFLRGLIDGDGCIRINNHQQISLSFCSGNQNCCQQVCSLLGLDNKVSFSSGVWRFQVTGNIKAKKILDKLYENSSYKTRLDRKYNVYRSLIK